VMTRQDDVDYAKLFSAEYGYHEAAASTIDQLATFMKSVDDLSALYRKSSGLVLGGRKILGRKYRSIEVEHIATIWQAEEKIQKARADWEAREKAVEDAFDARWRHRTYRGDYERRQLEREHDRDLAEMQDQLKRDFFKLKLVKGSGFSLDPTPDYESLSDD